MIHHSIWCRRILYSLVAILIVEGLLRKILPSFVGLGIFFLKDFLCVAGIYCLFVARLDPITGKLKSMLFSLVIAFIPLLVNTAIFDVLLVPWAIKQYLLYATAAFLVPMAFPAGSTPHFFRFLNFFALTLIPTTLVAILQNRLPPDHWLNLSVGGDSLEHFSAAGYLRVSSTFAFNAQYAYYLMMACVFFGARYFGRFPRRHLIDWISKVIPAWFLGVLLLVGSYITGGRTAVLGCFAVLSIGVLLSAYKSPSLFLRKAIIAVPIMVAALLFLRSAKPELFAAYEKRSSGSDTYQGATHVEQVSSRVADQLFGWTSWAFERSPRESFLGGGLGVMSNGVQQISSYASSIRESTWTETDQSNTAWEGGIYMVIIWYGFRFWVILFSFRLWKSILKPDYAAIGALAFGFVLINGVIGTLGIQPPLAIWWWLSVGILIALSQADRYEIKKKKLRRLSSASDDGIHDSGPERTLRLQ